MKLRHDSLLIVAVGLLAGLSSVSPACAESAKKEAEQHAGRGVHAFEIKDYQRAATEFRAAYVLDANPDYLYAVAQAQRLGGDCQQAIATYQEYLGTHPSPEGVEKANHNISECRAPATAPAEHQPLGATGLAVAGEPTRPGVWYRDPLIDVMGGIGAASLLTGVTLLLVAEVSAEEANGAPTIGEYYGHGLGVNKDRDEGILFSLVGAGLAGGAALRYWLYFRPGDTDATVGAVPLPGGAAVMVGGQF